MLSCLLLSISTCITMSTGQLIEGKRIEELKKESNTILKIASNELNITEDKFPNYNLKYIDNDVQLILLETMSNIGFASDDLQEELLEVKDRFVQSYLDTNFKIDEIKDNSLFNNGSYDDSIIMDFASLIKDTTGYCNQYQIDDIFVDDFEISTEGTSIEKDDIETGTIDKTTDNVEETIEQLPLIENHDNTKLQANVNNKIDGKIFIGFDFVKDTCIS